MGIGNSALIALRLVLDTAGAEDKASGLVKAMNAVSQEFEKAGAQMENTLRGRLVNNVIGAFRNSFSTLINEEIPSVLRESKLQVELAAAVAGVVSEGAANLTRMLAENQMRAGSTVFNQTANTMMQLTGGQISPDDAGFKDMFQALAHANAASYQTRQNLMDAMATQYDATPGVPSLRFNPMKAARNAVGMVGESVGNLTGAGAWWGAATSGDSGEKMRAIAMRIAASQGSD